MIDHEERENYLENRNNILIDFQNALDEVQREEPSVGGEIAGMDFKQFQAAAVFIIIKEQEQYADENNILSTSPWVDIEEEKKILEDMVTRAKEIFSDYDKWYNSRYSGR